MFQNIMLGYSMRSILNWLEEWHKENAFEDGYALNITIKALDNPGWMIDIDLNDTIYSSISMDEIRIDCHPSDYKLPFPSDCLDLKVGANTVPLIVIGSFPSKMGNPKGARHT